MNDPASSELRVADFLAWENGQLSPHELINGQIVSMTTPTRLHAATVRRLRTLIERAVEDGCDVYDVYAGDMTVAIDNTPRHSAPRPDIMVTCDPSDRRPEDLRTTSIRYPKLIVEVLSPTTAEIDTASGSLCFMRISTMRLRRRGLRTRYA